MKRDKNNDEHALASSRPSYRPRHPVILTAIRHTHCLFAYRFPLPGLFTKHATPTVVYPLLIPVSFLVSSYPVSSSVSFLYRLVYQYRIRYIVPSGFSRWVLLIPSHRPA